LIISYGQVETFIQNGTLIRVLYNVFEWHLDKIKMERKRTKTLVKRLLEGLPLLASGKANFTEISTLEKVAQHGKILIPQSIGLPL
jgi:hypothetical protein